MDFVYRIAARISAPVGRDAETLKSLKAAQDLHDRIFAGKWRDLVDDIVPSGSAERMLKSAVSDLERLNKLVMKLPGADTSYDATRTIMHGEAAIEDDPVEAAMKLDDALNRIHTALKEVSFDVIGHADINKFMSIDRDLSNFLKTRDAA